MRIGREAGDDQDGVVARRRQRAPGLVGDARAVQGAAALHRKGEDSACQRVPGGMNSVIASV